MAARGDAPRGLAAAWLLRGRVGRGPFAALLVYVGVLFPALGFVNVYPMRFSWVADHFAYQAVAVLAAACRRVARRRWSRALRNADDAAPRRRGRAASEFWPARP